MRKIVTGLLSTVLALSLLAGCGSKTTTPAPAANGTQPAAATAKTDKLKVAFVYIGPVGDAGYTYSHDQGRKALQDKLGDKVEITTLESIPEGADSERVFEELAQKGNKVIFGTSFGYMDAMLNVAKRHPDVYFYHASGYKTAPNMSTYFGREYQARFLSGIVAGLQTKKNLIGFVAAFPIPEVVRGVDSFTLGVRAVNPAAKVKVVWTNTWYDPAKEKDAANSLLDVGADVLTMYQDSPATLQAAAAKGAFFTGYHSDMAKFAPKAFLTAAVWNWGPFYVKAVQSVLDGKFKSEQYWGPMSDGVVALTPIADFANPAAKTKVDEYKQKILSGSWDVFSGPIKDDTGKERVAAGGKLTDEQMLSLNWLVEGVQGTMPKN